MLVKTLYREARIYKVSTANPAEGGVKPNLQTNWLGFEIIRNDASVTEIKSRGSRLEGSAYYIDGVRLLADKATPKSKVSQNMFNTEFETNIAYSR
jgi:hypothetical protein